MAAKFRNSDRHIYCLCSDGEWQEGSCWEALAFSTHRQLNNLTIIIDQNGLQGFGKTEEIMSCGDLTSRVLSFGAHVQHIDGHDCAQIKNALENKSSQKPSVVIMDTIKAKGTYYEGKMESHYLPLSEDQYRDACLMLTGDVSP
jgi:transketolase